MTWETKTIGECAEIVSGGTPSTTVPQFWDGGVLWCTPTDITRAKSKYLSETERTLTDMGLQKSAAVLLPVGAILLCSRATIGEMSIAKKPISTNQGFKNLICNENVDNEFLYYLLQTKRKAMLEQAIGSTFLEISKKALSGIEISLPPLLEQRAVAAALSDVDGYIAALERLIAKKRNIKQGAMQELLTGKRRLPGFRDEWVEKKIMDFPADVMSGGTPSTFVSAFWGGSIPWMNSGELNLKRVYSVEGRITQLGLEHSSTTMVPANSILIGLAGQGKTRGTVALNYIDLCTNQSIAAILPNPSVYCSEYLYQNLDSRYDELRELSTGDGGRGGLNLTILRNLTVSFPPLNEQTAIAAILSDMDAEIDALMAKLYKVRNIKQGMMQELLTGRIRLVKQETIADTVFAPKDAKLPKPASKRHSPQFDDAVVITGIVAIWAENETYPLGRKKIQKLLYLFRRHQKASTKQFHKKPAGPYADSVRYQGGELIAKNKGYIFENKSERGSAFRVGENAQEAFNYIIEWKAREDFKWLKEHFHRTGVDELELLATVDMAICDLEETNTSVSVASIKHLIGTDKEWKAKLERQTFSDANIAKAIEELRMLM